MITRKINYTQLQYILSYSNAYAKIFTIDISYNIFHVYHNSKTNIFKRNIFSISTTSF